MKEYSLFQKVLLIAGTVFLLSGTLILIIATNKEINIVKDNINRKLSNQMSECWKDVEKYGGVCEIEYTYESGIPVTGEVIRK